MPRFPLNYNDPYCEAFKKLVLTAQILNAECRQMNPTESKDSFARQVTEALLEKGAITALPIDHRRTVHLYILKVDKRKWFFVSLIKNEGNDRNLAEFSISIRTSSRKLFDVVFWCVLVSLFEKLHEDM